MSSVSWWKDNGSSLAIIFCSCSQYLADDTTLLGCFIFRRAVINILVIMGSIIMHI